jgi:hypothetical protein
MELKKLKLDNDYLSGLIASVDWIAGGNFDGYIFRYRLRFSSENRIVTLETIVIDESRYDGKVNPDVHRGVYKDSDKATITCVFDDFEMRGKILGKNNQYIAFSSMTNDRSHSWSGCFELAS